MPSCARLSAAVAILGTAALLHAANAPGTIVPQRGIAGVSLGMTQARVRAILGAPARIVRGQNDFGPYTAFVFRGLQVFFQGDRKATLIRTTRRSERTPGGIGVGSSERRLRRTVSGLRCEGNPSERRCFLGRYRPGRRVTTFDVRRGRVTSVAVGFVID